MTPSLSSLLCKALAFDQNPGFERENTIHYDGRSFEHARLKPYLELFIDAVEALDALAKEFEYDGEGFNGPASDMLIEISTLLSEKVGGTSVR